MSNLLKKTQLFYFAKLINFWPISLCLSCLVYQAASDSCPYGWLANTNTSSCYYLTSDSNQQFQFNLTVDKCKWMESELVTLDTEDELKWLTEQTNLRSSRQKGWWLGYVLLERDLTLTNGSSAATSFLSRKYVFTLTDKRNQTCLSLLNGTLNSVECNQELGYICKRSMNWPLKCNIEESWTYIQGSCLRFFTTPATWANAIEMCEYEYASLARIQTKEQMLYVWKLARMSSTTSWNGFSFNNVINQFQWVEGPPFIQWWSKSVYELRGNNSDICGLINGTENMTSAWTTGSCFEEHPFTCVQLSGVCPDGWDTLDDTCLKIFQKPKLRWSHAKDYCTNLGAELLKITSQKFQDQISFLVSPLVDSIGSFWIGLTDKTGNFTWSDESSINFTNWAKSAFVNLNLTEGEKRGFIQAGNVSSSVVSNDRGDEKGQWWVDKDLKKKSFGCSLSKNNLNTIVNSHTNTTDSTSASRKQVSFDADCGMMWEKRPGTDLCYQFRETKMTWFHALQHCIDHNSSLASITSSEEQNYVEGKLRHLDIFNFWIGASDKKEIFNIQWEDGAVFTFFNWDDGKPEYSNIPNCVGINTESMAWSDFSCYILNGFICKKKAFSAKVTPTPAVTSKQLASGLYYGCNHGWLKYGDNCYKINMKKISIQKAADTCKKWKSYLVSIHSKEENGFLWSQLPKDTLFWIGTPLSYSGSIFWLDRTPVNFTNFARSTDSYSPEAFNVLYIEQGNGKWTIGGSRVIVFWKLGYICKRPTIIVSFPPVIPYSVGCLEGGYAYAEFCYTFYSNNTSWDQAERICQQQKGNLATVSNSVTNDFISSVFGAQRSSFWIGLSVLKGRTKWVNGITSQTFFWDHDYNGNSDGCAAIKSDVQRWHLQNCSFSLPFVCETGRQGFTTPIVTTTTLAPTTVMATCPSTWLQNNGICYKSFSLKKSWHEARFHCESLGANLPSIHDMTTNNYISDLVKSNNFENSWIGLHDTSIETAFEWTDGSPYDFSQWGISEPNSLTISEDCGEIAKDSNWNDLNCHVIRPYICSMKPGAPTIPSPVSTTPAPKCLGGDWSYHKGYCYFFSDVYKSWRKARQECLSKGGDLASVQSEEENNFLLHQSYVKSITGDLWIGYSKIDKNTFVWSDGKPSGFEAFISSKTDWKNYQCVKFRTEHAGWYIDRCTSELKYICKRLNDTTDSRILSTTPLIVGTCPSGFVGSDISNKCYMLRGLRNESRLSWSDAKDTCANISYEYKVQLASISNAQEQNLVNSLMTKLYYDVWIGMSFDKGKRTFSWLDESDVEFTNWLSGYPFHFFEHYDDFPYFYSPNQESYYTSYPFQSCVKIMSTETSANWVLQRCDTKNPYLCQTYKVPGLITSSPTVSHCPIGFSQLGSTCFLLMSEGKSWEEASKFCQRRGAHLVAILDLQELETLNYLQQRHNFSTVFWLGLKFNKMVSKFEWTNDLPVLKTFWSRHSLISNAENMICSGSNISFWTQFDCNRKLPFICEIRKDIPKINVPTAASYCADRKQMKFGKFCYLIRHKEKVSWPEANHKCQQKNMHLVSIHSNEQVEFLLDEFKRLNDSHSHNKHEVNFWTGLTAYQAGFFGWSDGSALEYIHWADGKTSKKTEEKCVEMNSTTGQWNDLNCYRHKLGFICQKPAETDLYTPASNRSDRVSSISITKTDTALIVIGCSVLVCGILAAVVVFNRMKRRRAPIPLTNQDGFCSVQYTALQEQEN